MADETSPRLWAGSEQGLKYLSVCLDDFYAQEALAVSDEDSRLAKNLRIKNFSFLPEELFLCQKLLWFLEVERPQYWPYVDKHTPIIENNDLKEVRCLHDFFWHSFKRWEQHKTENWNHDPFTVPYEREAEFSVFRFYTRAVWSEDLAADVVNVPEMSKRRLALDVLRTYPTAKLSSAECVSDLRDGTFGPKITAVIEGRVISETNARAEMTDRTGTWISAYSHGAARKQIERYIKDNFGNLLSELGC